MTKSERYSLTLSDGTVEWATYYGIEPTACRVRQPRDKGPVESAVNHLYHYIYARIENDTFYELDDINSRIWELLDEYCSLSYKAVAGGRSSRSTSFLTCVLCRSRCIVSVCERR